MEPLRYHNKKASQKEGKRMQYQQLFELQLMMFLLMLTGFVLRKINIITQEGKQVLTDLVISVILPCNIINAFQISLDMQVLRACGLVVVISLLLQLGCTLISAFCYNKVPKEQRMIFQYATVCSNAGFLGNPVAEGLYGSLGLLYASVYLIPQRVVMWSAGVSYFTDLPSKKEVVRKVLTHPCNIAMAIGLVLMATQLPLPAFLSRSIRSLGNCTTPITMLLIGAIMAESGFSGILSKNNLVFCLIRLVLIPAGVLAGCLLAQVDATVAGVCIILAAMPAGSTTAILAAKYNADTAFASSCVVLTTLVSTAILPLWCLVLNACL